MRRRREFISLFGAMAAAWSLAAHAQESATMRATEATRGTLPQIEMPRFRAIKLDLAKLDKLIDEFYQRALKEHDPHSAVVAIKAWERKHDLAGDAGCYTD